MHYRESSNKGQRLYEMRKDAEWKAEEADLFATALDLIATGTVPEEQEEETQATTTKVKRRVPGQVVEGE